MLDRLDARGAKHARKGAADDFAIGQHVGDARRHAQIVFEHDEGAVFAPHQIGAADIDISAVRHGQPMHLAAVMLRAVYHLARDHAVLEHAAIGVDVAQEQIERDDALLEARLDPRPFFRRDDPRQQIGRDDPLRRLIVGVDGEGDALMEEGLFASLLAARQFFRRQSRNPCVEGGALGAHAAIGREHLVIGASQDVVLEGRITARPGARGSHRLGLVVVDCC